MSIRTINISLEEQYPRPRTVGFWPDQTALDNELLLDEVYIAKTNAAGVGTINLPVKSAGSIHYRVEVDGEDAGSFNLTTGAPIDLEDLLVAGLPPSDSMIDYINEQLEAYAPIDSPALMGVPTAPTAATGNDTTQIATTAFVNAEIAADIPMPISLAKGGTGVALVDPNADRIFFWDDSAGHSDWLSLGTGLSITGTVLNGTPGLTIGSPVSGGAAGQVLFADGLQNLAASSNLTFNGTKLGTPQVNIVPVAGDPGSPANGDLWYNSSTNKFRARQGGASVDVILAVSGLTMGVTPSDGVANRILKTDGAGKVGNSSWMDLGNAILYNAANADMAMGDIAGTGQMGFNFNLTSSIIFRDNGGGVDTTFFSGGWCQATPNKRLTAVYTNATAGMTNLTDLTQNVKAGQKISGHFALIISNSAAAEGFKFDLGGGTCTFTSVQFSFNGQPIASTIGVRSSTVAGTAITLTALGDVNDVMVEVFITAVINAAGTFIPRAAENSHTSGTLTIRAGSIGPLLQMSN